MDGFSGGWLASPEAVFCLPLLGQPMAGLGLVLVQALGLKGESVPWLAAAEHLRREVPAQLLPGARKFHQLAPLLLAEVGSD